MGIRYYLDPFTGEPHIRRHGVSEAEVGDVLLTMKKKSGFPQGWDEERVQRVLEHYEEQTEAEAVAEDEAAFEDQTQAVMEVPRELVQEVRHLIAKHKAKGAA